MSKKGKKSITAAIPAVGIFCRNPFYVVIEVDEENLFIDSQESVPDGAFVIEVDGSGITLANCEVMDAFYMAVRRRFGKEYAGTLLTNLVQKASKSQDLEGSITELFFKTIVLGTPVRSEEKDE